MSAPEFAKISSKSRNIERPAGEKIEMRVTRAMTKAKGHPIPMLPARQPPIVALRNKKEHPEHGGKRPIPKEINTDPPPPPPEENVAAVAPKPKRRKPEGMQFDDTYIEYNGKFVQACSSLQGCVTRWSETLSASQVDIPEEYRSDIESYLGQAKLLIKSKLPQFAKLLYLYLCYDGLSEGCPLLPVDLQGWWDVAMISVDQVLGRFENLVSLEAKNWKEPQVGLGSEKDVKPSSSTTPKANITKKTPKKKPKPNAGLLAFLAGKRKKAAASVAKEQSSILSTSTSENESQTEQICAPSRSPSPDRTFEGGFFTIQSPARVLTPKQQRRA